MGQSKKEAENEAENEAAAKARMKRNKNTWKVAIDCIHCGLKSIFRLNNGVTVEEHFKQQSVGDADMCPKCKKNPQL